MYGFALDDPNKKKKQSQYAALNEPATQANVASGSENANVSTPIGKSLQQEQQNNPVSQSPTYKFSLGKPANTYNPNANHAPAPAKPPQQPQQQSNVVDTLVSTLKDGLAKLEQLVTHGNVTQPNAPQNQPLPQQNNGGLDLANPVNTQSAQPTITQNSLKNETVTANKGNALANRVSATNKEFQDQIAGGLKDLQQGVVPTAQAPSTENPNTIHGFSATPNNPQGQTTKELSAAQQKLFNEPSVQRINKDVGIGITHLVNGGTFGILNILGEGAINNKGQTTPEQNVVGNATEIAGQAALIPAVDLLKFTAVATGVEQSLKKITSKQNLSDLLPSNAPAPAKIALDVVQTLGEAFIAHQLNGANFENARNILTKNIITTYNIPKQIQIPADKMASIFGTPSSGAKISPEELDLVKAAGLSGSSYRDAVKYGLTINVPTEKVITIVDKPYWQKLKGIIGVKSEAKSFTLSSQAPGATPTIAGQLPEETQTLQGEKKTKYDTADVVQARKDLATTLANPVDTTTPQRVQFRADLTNKLYENGGYINAKDRPNTSIRSNKRADIVTGLPASGKNTILSTPLVKEHGAILIDSDEAKIGIPESNGGSSNGAVHEESTTITNDLLKKSVQKGNNIVMPIVGGNADKVKRIVDNLAKQGYEVHLHHLDISLDTSMKRAVERFKNTGKFVDPAHIQSYGLKPNENYGILKTYKGVKSYEKYSNEVPQGQPPKLIERSQPTSENANVAGSNTGSNRVHGGVNGTNTGGNEPQTSQSVEQPTAELKAALEDTNTVKEALHSGDTEGAKALYDSFAADNKSIPSFEEITAQVDDEKQKAVSDVKKQLESEKSADPEDPTNKLLAIADKLDAHFRTRGQIFQITGKNRVLSDNGEMLTLGGDAKSAFDRLIYATDLPGFSKNIRLLAQKYNSTYTEIHDIIQKGGIDGAEYDKFQQRFQELRAAERTNRAGRSADLQSSPQGQSENAGASSETPNSSRVNSQNPIGSGKVKKSKAYTRVYDRLLEETRLDINYNVKNSEQDVENALRYISENPKEALQVAKGLRNPPAGQTETAISIALADKEYNAGNEYLASQLEASRSLRQTRRGQEIQAEAGRFNENSPYRFIQQVISARLNILGRSQQNILKNVQTDVLNQISSVKKAAIAKIDQEAEKLGQEIKKTVPPKKTVQEDLQSFIDQITCK